MAALLIMIIGWLDYRTIGHCGRDHGRQQPLIPRSPSKQREEGSWEKVLARRVVVAYCVCS